MFLKCLWQKINRKARKGLREGRKKLNVFFKHIRHIRSYKLWCVSEVKMEGHISILKIFVVKILPQSSQRVTQGTQSFSTF